MYEVTPKEQMAVLVGVDTGEFDAQRSMEELKELTKTAGAEPTMTFMQRRDSCDKATCIGKGRLEEIAEFCRQEEVDIIIFDRELTATQIRNIEETIDVRVVDRTALILDIFAMRARSTEGRLQVELAQLKYRLPRLSGLGTSLSRLGGGIGTRGPGETKLETDRRHIRRRISSLEGELKELKERRQRMRTRRKKDSVTSVAVVGYTNAGKSTLLNSLTGAGVLAENKLFATLDPTARALQLPDGRSVLLIDTVGFISRLPHDLVEAFHSTLEEASHADLILHVIDASNEEAIDQVEVVKSLLLELDCGGIPVLDVYNKCDRLVSMPAITPKNSFFISAKTGVGFDALLKGIARALEPTATRMRLLIPYDNGGVIAKIRDLGKVFEEEYVSDGIFVDTLVDRTLYGLVDGYKIEEKPKQ